MTGTMDGGLLHTESDGVGLWTVMYVCSFFAEV